MGGIHLGGRLVKILAIGKVDGEFQFKHLSFQEALFDVAVMRGEVSLSRKEKK